MVTPGRPDGHSKGRKGIHEIYENQYYVFKYTGDSWVIAGGNGTLVKGLNWTCAYGGGNGV